MADHLGLVHQVTDVKVQWNVCRRYGLVLFKPGTLRSPNMTSTTTLSMPGFLKLMSV